MGKKPYYDEETLKIAISQENTDPYGTCKTLERYCSQYPKDRMALRDYARVLIKVGRLDDAEIALNKLKTLTEEARKAECDKSEDIDKDEDYLRSTTLKLLAWQKKYEEALAYFEKYKDSIKRTNEIAGPIEYYCKRKLGMIPRYTYTRSALHYRDRQIADYQENDCLYHIHTKHLNESERVEELNENEGAFFENDFPFDTIYQEVKETIREFQAKSNQEAKRLNWNFPINIYVFKYPNCGKTNGQLVDYFIVAALCDTNNIITMYPAAECEKMPHFDLSHIIPPSKMTQHTRSRSARFYARYGIQKK